MEMMSGVWQAVCMQEWARLHAHQDFDVYHC